MKKQKYSLFFIIELRLFIVSDQTTDLKFFIGYIFFNFENIEVINYFKKSHLPKSIEPL